MVYYEADKRASLCLGQILRLGYTPPYSSVRRHVEPSASLESLSVALRAHPIFFNYLSVEATETDGDGKGCDWSSNKIISGITLHLIYFVPCLLCTLRHQIRFEKLWKFFYNTIYMVSSQHIRSIGRQIALRIRHPDRELLKARGISVVTESDYGLRSRRSILWPLVLLKMISRRFYVEKWRCIWCKTVTVNLKWITESSFSLLSFTGRRLRRSHSLCVRDGRFVGDQ